MVKRTDSILVRNYGRYLLPAILVGVGNALQQFVDTILVANLIGPNAIAVEGYAGPLVQVYSVINMLLGVGGALLFAAALGRMDRKRASELYSTGMISAAVIGSCIMIPGLFLVGPLAKVLGCSPELLGDFRSYLVPTLILCPISTVIMVFASFLPAMGYPGLTSKLIILANAANVMLDVVYIKFFRMGIAGAQWATVSGYIVSVVWLFFHLRIRGFRFPPIRHFDASQLREILVRGLPPALSQIGLVIYFLFFNRLVTDLGGRVSMQAFSLCLQLLSLLAILIYGVSSNLNTFIGILSGQMDNHGVRSVCRTSVIIAEAGGLLLFLFVQLFPGVFADLYSLTEARELGIHALRIYSWLMPVKGLALISRDYYNGIGHTKLAMSISMIEGSLGIILMGLLLTRFMGLDGVWLAFPLTSLLCVLAIGVYTFLLRKHPEDEPAVAAFEMTLSPLRYRQYPSEEIVEKITRIFVNVPEEIQTDICLLIEEMYLYTTGHAPKTEYIDVMIRQTKAEIILLFRSLGDPFDPLSVGDGDNAYNLMILNGLPDEIRYDYTVGMNMTRLVIEL